MPTYQYACTDCGHTFEQVQSFSEDSLTVCPQCEGRLRKVFNAVGVVFKGSGFYRNDSRAGQGAGLAQHRLAGHHGRERARGRHAERVHRFADQVFAQHGAECGLAVAAASERRAPGSLQVQVPATPVDVDDLPDQKGAPIA